MLGLFAAALLVAQPAPDLRRLAEEAEVFAAQLKNIVGTEILTQRALKAPPRFRPRVGAAAYDPPKASLQTRQVQSEFGYGQWEQGGWRELREVTSVDGSEKIHAKEARARFVRKLTSDDEKTRRRLLEEFERLGLVGAASDFSLLLLLFTAEGIQNFEYEPAPVERLGGDVARTYHFKQKSGKETFTVFDGRDTVRLPLQGRLWLRSSDGLPLRMEFRAEFLRNKVKVADFAQVDYVRSAAGFLIPVAVVHRRTEDEAFRAENVFRYSNFQRFQADAEIKFTEVPDPPPPPK
ncbi:MAG: hypothetical protein MUC42_00945 [Bryobacter sp.]|nr:hypothetical protein [Bryobacter sp.]